MVGWMINMKDCVLIYSLWWSARVCGRHLFSFPVSSQPATCCVAIQSNSTFKDCCLGNHVLYVRKLGFFFFFFWVPLKTDPGSISLYESWCVCVCLCVCWQLRKLVIDAERKIMSNLGLCLYGCFVYTWVEENTWRCVLQLLPCGVSHLKIEAASRYSCNSE